MTEWLEGTWWLNVPSAEGRYVDILTVLAQENLNVLKSLVYGQVVAVNNCDIYSRWSCWKFTWNWNATLSYMSGLLITQKLSLHILFKLQLNDLDCRLYQHDDMGCLPEATWI